MKKPEPELPGIIRKPGFLTRSIRENPRGFFDNSADVVDKTSVFGKTVNNRVHNLLIKFG